MSKSTIVAAPFFLNKPGYFGANSYSVARLSALYSVASGNLPKRRRLVGCSDMATSVCIGADGGGLNFYGDVIVTKIASGKTSNRDVG
jgi:hypothetical protein